MMMMMMMMMMNEEEEEESVIYIYIYIKISYGGWKNIKDRYTMSACFRQESGVNGGNEGGVLNWSSANRTDTGLHDEVSKTSLMENMATRERLKRRNTVEEVVETQCTIVIERILNAHVICDMESIIITNT